MTGPVARHHEHATGTFSRTSGVVSPQERRSQCDTMSHLKGQWVLPLPTTVQFNAVLNPRRVVGISGVSSRSNLDVLSQGGRLPRKDTPMVRTDERVFALLTRTLQRFVAADAHITHVNSVPLRGGMSGAAVWRHAIQYQTDTTLKTATINLITKDAEHHEWHVLRHLQSQHLPNIPFADASDTPNDERVLLCLQDLGDQNRPSSLDPISETELVREARALATIHAAHFQQLPQLDWLPVMSPTYIHDMLFERTWRPTWEAAVGDARFATTFREAIPRVEAAAATIVNDMAMLLQETAQQTLIHADLNPSNVLVFDGQPYFMDWQTAMRGPCYIDLPHHHCTLTQAEHYRVALAAHGYVIPPQDFAERYRVAARYIGLRYMWWTLDYWREDPTQTRWVQHYLNLVTGDSIR